MDWKGCPAVVIASGPSLTEEDCELIRLTGINTISVNTACKLAPWAHVLYAGDTRWWQENQDLWMNLEGDRWTCSKNAHHRFQCQFRPQPGGPGYNSGTNAVELACHFKADPVIMLGFDFSLSRGIHFHGEHQKTSNPTHDRVKKWHKQLQKAVKDNKQTTIINCSRYTEIDCIERMELEHALKELEIG